MKRVCLVTILLLVSCSVFGGYPFAFQNDAACAAGTDVDILLTVDQQDFYAQQIRCELTVQYVSLAVYDPNIKAAYHVYGEDGTLLLFEGERQNAIADEKGISRLIYDIDVSESLKQNDGKKLKIVFDLIDETNALWLSENPHINIQADAVYVEPNGLKEALRIINAAMKKQTFAFVANILVFVCFVIVGGYIIKNKKKIF